MPRALRLKAPPVWLEAEGARRSAATIGSITAAATASSSESSISTRTRKRTLPSPVAKRLLQRHFPLAGGLAEAARWRTERQRTAGNGAQSPHKSPHRRPSAFVACSPRPPDAGGLSDGRKAEGRLWG